MMKVIWDLNLYSGRNTYISSLEKHSAFIFHPEDWSSRSPTTLVNFYQTTWCHCKECHHNSYYTNSDLLQEEGNFRTGSYLSITIKYALQSTQINPLLLMKPETVRGSVCLVTGVCSWCCFHSWIIMLLCSPHHISHYARFHAKWAATIHPSQVPRQLNFVLWHLIFSA